MNQFGLCRVFTEKEVTVETKDADELRVLYECYGDELRRTVRRLTRDADLAEDIVHEAFTRLARSSVPHGELRSARAWLHTVTRNLVVDHWRAAGTRHELPHAELPDRPAPDHVDRLFDAIVVREALQTLNEHHRLVVVLAYFQRLTVAEIATRLELAPGTVKSRLHYAMKALRLALQERGAMP